MKAGKHLGITNVTAEVGSVHRHPEHELVQALFAGVDVYGRGHVDRLHIGLVILRVGFVHLKLGQLKSGVHLTDAIARSHTVI